MHYYSPPSEHKGTTLELTSREHSHLCEVLDKTINHLTHLNCFERPYDYDRTLTNLLDTLRHGEIR